MLSRALAVTTAVPQIGGPPRKPVMTSVRSNLFRLLPARLDQGLGLTMAGRVRVREAVRSPAWHEDRNRISGIGLVQSPEAETSFLQASSTEDKSQWL